MRKRFLPYAPDQLELAPRRLSEMLPEDHLCFFVSEVVDQLDISVIEKVYKELRGGPWLPSGHGKDSTCSFPQ